MRAAWPQDKLRLHTALPELVNRLRKAKSGCAAQLRNCATAQPVISHAENGLQGEKPIDGLDGNNLLKTYAFSTNDKMAAGAYGRARNYG